MPLGEGGPPTSPGPPSQHLGKTTLEMKLDDLWESASNLRCFGLDSKQMEAAPSEAAVTAPGTAPSPAPPPAVGLRVWRPLHDALDLRRRTLGARF